MRPAWTGPLGKMETRLTAIVLAFLVPCLVFAGVGIRAVAQAGEEQARATTYLVAGLVLTVLALAAIGMLRRRYGVTLGWVVMLATLASGVVEPVMAVVGVIFLALWVTALVQGRKMDALTAEYLARRGRPH